MPTLTGWYGKCGISATLTGIYDMETHKSFTTDIKSHLLLHRLRVFLYNYMYVYKSREGDVQ